MDHQGKPLREGSSEDNGYPVQADLSPKSGYFSLDQIAEWYATFRPQRNEVLCMREGLQATEDSLLRGCQITTARNCVAYDRLHHGE